MKTLHGKGEILFHKVVAENGDICFVLLEGIDRDNQTQVRFDAAGKTLKSVTRSFLGSGSLIISSPKSLHKVRIELRNEGKELILSDIGIKAFIPEKRIWYDLHCHDLDWMEMGKSEQRRIYGMIHEYWKNESKH